MTTPMHPLSARWVDTIDNQTRLYITRHKDTVEVAVASKTPSTLLKLWGHSALHLANLLTGQNFDGKDTQDKDSFKPRSPSSRYPQLQRPPKGRGKRHTVADLITAGMLSEGTTLVCQQGDIKHKATVLEDGRLMLKDGKSYESPSAAVSAIGAGKGGWAAWHLPSGTKRLMDMRWELRLKEFPPPGVFWEEQEMAEAAKQWFQYTTTRDLNPATRDDEVVETFLESLGIDERTEYRYRRHLEMWFAFWEGR